MTSSLRRSILRLCLVTLSLMVSVNRAQSAPLCIAGNTLDQYITTGSCTVGEILFSDFAQLAIPGAATQIPASQVIVSPLGVDGLQFALNLSADAGEFFDIRFGYNVSGLLFNTVDLEMAGASATGDGVVTAIKDICLGAPFDTSGLGGCPAGPSGTSVVFAIDGFDDLAETFGPFAAVAQLGIIDDLGIDGGLAGTGTLNGSVSNRFTGTEPVPEPATGLLVLTGLAAAARRRQRRSPPRP